MSNYNNYNYNSFLLALDEINNKTIYARITALTFDEQPIETIEGRVTGGSINIDGASALRRTCSVTMVAQNYNHNDFYIGLNTKFKLEIGVENTIDSTKPKIIWFKQGIYVITAFNTSRSTTGFNISISGKDKMVLLNGEVGGSLAASTDFGSISEEVNGNWIIRKIPIYDIIKNAVHVYAGEPFHNIIINDLETYGIELLEYRYDIPMYLYRETDSDTTVYKNALLENNYKQWYLDENQPSNLISLKDIQKEHLDMLVDPLTGSVNAKPVYSKEYPKGCYLTKIEYGQTAGYRTTDLVYAGDLIGNVGESLTSILDKIRNMLTEFEYFYNVDGQFVFQKKQSVIETMWSSTGDGEQYMSEATAFASNYIYKFFNNTLITAFNNNPNLLNLRNDFSIWGERESVSGAKIPVHMRYAIDEKPVEYTTICVSDEDLKAYNEKYGTSLKGQEHEIYSVDKWDWREIIYQMANDYFKYNHLDDFELRVAQANPDLYPGGRTGYENYYTDIQGFWRQLYNPELDNQIDIISDQIDAIDEDIKTETNPVKKEILEKEKKSLEQKQEDLEDEKENYFQDGDNIYWNKNVYAQPYLLNFWFDFLDSSYDFEMAKYSVKAIGSRPKAINDTNIKAIYFRDTPDIIFVKTLPDDKLPGFRYIQVGDYEDIFSISAQGKSAKNKLDELLYQHSYCIESANITSIPIYYLEPNTRIYVEDQETGLQGDYIVSKITIPLTYNGTMSITATKAAENII